MENQDMLTTSERLKTYIEELNMARRAVEESRDRYADLYDNAPAACFTVDLTSDKILEANLTAGDLLRTDRDTLLKSAFARFVAPEFTDVFRTCSRKALAEPYRVTCELKMRRSDGQAFWSLLQIQGARGYGEVRLAAADITGRKETEQVKDDFIGMVSHELRTPLTVIMGCLKVARSEGVTPEDMNELLQEASRSSNSLLYILENLIELSRYQSHRLKLDMISTNIAGVIRDIVRSETAHISEHRLWLDIDEGLPEVEVDEFRLQRILRNLLDNAAKYSPDNTEIHVIARQENGNLLIGVRDQGKGISPEDQARLFAPFERLREGSTTRPGLGLGLLVCKRLVEAHGGSIWVESSAGRGSTFWFTLPLSTPVSKKPS
jgi:PAS domain S-box-containing protein